MEKGVAMKPIKFKQANIELQKPKDMTDEECKSLWVYRGATQSISCWKLSFKERLKALLFGKVWLGVAGTSQPPVWLDCNKDVFE